MRARAAIIAGATAASLAGCSSTGPARSTPAAPVAEAHLVIPPGAVPWAPLAFVPYEPTPLPAPPPSPAPQCGVAELSFTSLDAVGAGGSDGVVVLLTNGSGTTCLAENYPRVTLDEPGGTGIVATSGGMFNGAENIGDIQPGAKAAFIVSGSSNCSTQPNPPYATRLTAQLPGGGTVSVALPGGDAQGSRSTLLTVPMSCGVWATHLFPYPVSQTPPPLPADPLVQLTVRISAPSSVIAHRAIVYVVDLHNAGEQTVALSPCRGYLQTLDGQQTPSSAYELNCADARAIPVHGNESFVIEMPEYAAAPGRHTLCWELDTVGSGKGRGGPSACAAFTIVP